MNSGGVPGLDQHFSNGKVAFPGFNTVRDAWNVTFRGQKMKVKELKRLNVGQLVVTKEEDGSLLAKERADYEKDFFDAMVDLTDALGCPRNARPGEMGGPVKGIPGAWDKFYKMSKDEQWEKMEMYRQLRNSVRKEKLAADERVMSFVHERIEMMKKQKLAAEEEKKKEMEQEKPLLDPIEQAKADKKKEANRKKREKQKLAKQVKKMENEDKSTDSETPETSENNISEMVDKLNLDD